MVGATRDEDQDNAMKVILKRDVKGLGREGDLKDVKDGYAHNFLIPNGAVVKADTGAVKNWERHREEREERDRAIRADAEALAERLRELRVEIAVKAGEKNRLFGSVTNREIAERLAGEGIEIDRHQPLPGAELRIEPAGQQSGGPGVADDDPVVRPGRQEQDGLPAPSAGIRQGVLAGIEQRGGQQRLGRRDPGDRQPEAVGDPLGRRDPDAKAGERTGPGAHDDPGQPRPAQVLLAQEPGDCREQGLAVAIAGRPGRQAVDLAVGRAARDDHLGRGGVDRQERPAAAVVGHAIARR